MDIKAIFRGPEIPQSPMEEVLTILRPIIAKLDQGDVLGTEEYNKFYCGMQAMIQLLNRTPTPESLASALEIVAHDGNSKGMHSAALATLMDALEAAKPLTFVSDWSKTEYLPTQWIIPDWLPAGRLTMLVGSGAVGKTHIGIQVATAVATQSPQVFIGIEPMPSLQPIIDQTLAGPPVVWATWETHIGDFQKRLRAATMNQLHMADERVHYVNLRPEGALWGPATGTHVSTAATLLETGTRLLRDAEALGARLLVVDPLAAAFLSNENDRGLVRAFTNHLAEWAARTGCAVLIIAHPPKNRGGSRGKIPDLDDLYSGSTDWPASMQSLWVFSRCRCEANAEEEEEEEPERCPYRQLWNAKVNEGPEGQPPLWFKWDTDTFSLTHHTPQRKTGRAKKHHGGDRNGRKSGDSQADNPKGKQQGFGGF